MSFLSPSKQSNFFNEFFFTDYTHHHIQYYSDLTHPIHPIHPIHLTDPIRRIESN